MELFQGNQKLSEMIQQYGFRETYIRKLNWDIENGIFEKLLYLKIYGKDVWMDFYFLEQIGNSYNFLLESLVDVYSNTKQKALKILLDLKNHISMKFGTNEIFVNEKYCNETAFDCWHELNKEQKEFVKNEKKYIEYSDFIKKGKK
jgi:hypothetical protein